MIAGSDDKPSFPDASSQLQFTETSGDAAVTASVAAAARESLMLAVPADAMLSSALFADFTREVAARIIQHYWREHINRHSTAQDPREATVIPQPGKERFSQHEPNPNYSEAPGPETEQEESLADALMRYRREDSTKAAVGCNSPQQVSSSRSHTQCGHSLLERTATTASVARASCGANTASDLAQASMSSLDKLKLRHGKQRRSERPTAQRAKHTLQASADLLPEASQPDGSAAMAVLTSAAASAQHAQQAHCSGAQHSSNPAQPARSDQLTYSSRGLEQESSDEALLQILNPRRHVQGLAPPVKAPSVSTDGMPLQQQQQKLNGVRAMPDTAEPQPGSDENVSPNMSPDQLHVKRLGHQTKLTEAFAAAAPMHMHQKPSSQISEMESHRVKAAEIVNTSHLLHSSNQRQKSGRLSSNKLADIFAFLDDVEAQAEAEAAEIVQSHAVHGATQTTEDHQQQRELELSHLKQRQNRPEHSSMSQRRQTLAHTPACSSSAPMPAGSQSAGTGHEHKTSVAASGKQTEAAYGQTTSDIARTAETASTG